MCCRIEFPYEKFMFERESYFSFYPWLIWFSIGRGDIWESCCVLVASLCTKLSKQFILKICFLLSIFCASFWLLEQKYKLLSLTVINRCGLIKKINWCVWRLCVEWKENKRDIIQPKKKNLFRSWVQKKIKHKDKHIKKSKVIHTS